MKLKCIEFGDKEFSTKEEIFDALLKHMPELIQLKKAAVYKSAEKGQYSFFDVKGLDASKASFSMDSNCVYPVINTTLYMDSHKDCHFNGIWDRTLKANAGSIFYVMEHNLKVGDVIAWPENVKAMVKMVPWSFVGKDYPGETQALIYEIPKTAIVNKQASDVISEKKPVQGSVRMQYVKMTLGINDKRKDFAEQKAYYDANIDKIANKSDVEEEGYFWGIEEAKIIKEGSMVLFGSNDATPIQYSDPEKFTLTDEPAEATQPIKTIIDYLIKN